MNVRTMIENAIRTGRESQHVALAASLFPSLGPVKSLCCWCCDEHAKSSSVARLPRGGECQECSYTGYDCLVVWSEIAEVVGQTARQPEGES